MTEQPGARVKATVELERDLWQKVRMQGLRENRPAVAIVEEALRQYLKQAREKGGK